MSGTDTPTKSNIHNKQYDDLLERYANEHGEINFDTIDYESIPYEDYLELSHYWSSTNHYQQKPEHLKVSYIKRLYAYKEQVEKLEDDVPKHRRFNLTLQVPQLTTAFKKAVRKGEVSKDSLLTIYRVVSQTLLSDPSITDDEIKAMHDIIRSRVNDMYDRRLAKRRRMTK